MALLALLITCGFQLATIRIDFLIVVKFLPPSNKQLRTHGKNLQGSHASGTTPSRVWSIMKLILRFSISIKKDWSGPHLYRCLPVLSRWPVTVTAMAAPRSTSAASNLGLSRWWLIFTGAVTGDWMYAIPHALQLAESVNSEFFAPVGNALITSREAEDLLHSYYLPSVRQHLTAFDGDNTVARPPQRTAGAAPAGSVAPVTATRESLCASGVYFR